MIRTYKKASDFLGQSFVDGEVIEFDKKLCKVSISRGGSLNKPTTTICLTHLSQVTVTEETEITLLNR
jgi:hypothetical protein